MHARQQGALEEAGRYALTRTRPAVLPASGRWSCSPRAVGMTLHLHWCLPSRSPVCPSFCLLPRMMPTPTAAMDDAG